MKLSFLRRRVSVAAMLAALLLGGLVMVVPATATPATDYAGEYTAPVNLGNGKRGVVTVSVNKVRVATAAVTPNGPGATISPLRATFNPVNGFITLSGPVTMGLRRLPLNLHGRLPRPGGAGSLTGKINGVTVTTALTGPTAATGTSGAPASNPRGRTLIISAQALPDALTTPVALRQLGLGVTDFLQLGGTRRVRIREALLAIDTQHPKRIYLLGMTPHHVGTIYTHTRPEQVAVFRNRTPGQITTRAIFTAAIRAAIRYAPVGPERNTGWKPPTIPPAATALPDSALPPAAPPVRAMINLTRLPPVANQGKENSCCGWATSYYYKSFQEAKQHKWAVTTPNHQFSPAFIYNQDNGGKDSGSNFWDAFKILKAQGDATLKDCPYTAGDYQTQPSADAKADAKVYTIGGYNYIFATYVKSSPAMDLTKLKKWLAHGDGLVISMKLPHSFKDYTSGIYDDHSKKYVYGHCMMVVGYDDDFEGQGIGAFRVVNSFGSNWGDAGFFWVSYDVFSQDTAEAWVMFDSPPAGKG